MANLTQTAANVAVGSDSSQIAIVQVGEAVTQGQPGYRSTSTNKYMKAIATSAAAANASGIFLTPASTNGYAVFMREGLINLGATLSVGETYVVSATSGAIAPVEDMTTGNYVTVLGVATTAALMSLKIQASGVAKP